MLRKQDLAKNNSRCSRGYAGYFDLNEKKIYIRSLKEYIVAEYLRVLEKLYSHISIGYEDDYKSRYRPDFFIYKNKKLLYIVEVKDNKKDAEKYLKNYRNLFRKQGIGYFVIYKQSQFERVKRHANISKGMIENWKRNSLYDYSGKNNPKFGIKLTEKTKRLIGDKTLERCKNPIYRKKLSEAMLKGWSNNLSGRKAVGDATRNAAKKRKIRRNLNDPFIEKLCVVCRAKIKKRVSEFEKIFNKHEFFACSSTCTVRKMSKNGKLIRTRESKLKGITNRLKSDIKKIKAYYRVFELNNIQTAKKDQIIANNSPLSIKTFNKYMKEKNRCLK